MNALEQFRDRVLAEVGDAEAEIDRPKNPLGAWWLDLTRQGRRVSVEWRPRRGFGVTARAAEYGSGADEVYDDTEIAADRVIHLLQTGEETHEPNEVRLGELREKLDISQDTVAKALGASQVAVSRLERRKDIRLSTLRRYIEALGGDVEVRIHVGDRSVYLTGFGPTARTTPPESST